MLSLLGPWLCCSHPADHPPAPASPTCLPPTPGSPCAPRRTLTADQARAHCSSSCFHGRTQGTRVCNTWRHAHTRAHAHVHRDTHGHMHTCRHGHRHACAWAGACVHVTQRRTCGERGTQTHTHAQAHRYKHTHVDRTWACRHTLTHTRTDACWCTHALSVTRCPSADASPSLAGPPAPCWLPGVMPKLCLSLCLSLEVCPGAGPAWTPAMATSPSPRARRPEGQPGSGQLGPRKALAHVQERCLSSPGSLKVAAH